MPTAFSIKSYRFQFPADLLTAWAVEMEVLILGWYVLVETESALALATIGALRFGGTLLSPLVGAFADRFSRKHMLVVIRATFATLALTMMISTFAGTLTPAQAFVVAALSGLIRPADMMLRQSLIADSVPGTLLLNAMALSRGTVDSARIAGALAGAGLMATLGMASAYAFVSGFYALSALLTVGLSGLPVTNKQANTRPFQDLVEGIRYLRRSRPIVVLLLLAFAVNLTALSLSGGMLPVVARDMFGFDERGLGMMVAIFAGGALLGSLTLATFMNARRPAKTMLISVVIWHLLLGVFIATEQPSVSLFILGLAGFVSSFTMVPMSTYLMVAIQPDYRGRVMGVRQLAVFGLPIGLLGAGVLTELVGIKITFIVYAAAGALSGGVLGFCLLRARDIALNERPQPKS